jgi:hypothetical protein
LLKSPLAIKNILKTFSLPVVESGAAVFESGAGLAFWSQKNQPGSSKATFDSIS